MQYFNKPKKSVVCFFKYLSGTLILLAAFGCVLLYFLPAPPLLAGMSFSKVVYDEKGNLLRLTLRQDDKYRVFTPLFKIAPNLKAATLLQEDYYFKNHFGINPVALVKAGWQTYVVGARRVGASTITMQVARLRFGMHSKKMLGKVSQILRALQLEMHYSKNEILEAYLNLAPYGGNIEGVGAASLIYFNKPAEKATLLEALTLSVIPQNPTQRSAQTKPLKKMRDKLFARWLEKHPEDVDKMPTKELPLVMHTISALPFIAPHFVNTVLTNSSVNTHEIHTTLESNLQKILERITQSYITRKKGVGVYNAAILLVDVRDRSIKGLVGSANFFDKQIGGQINGTEIKRSPGSTLKPFIYGLALDQGLIHPDTVLKDVPQSFGNYNPENFDYDFMGPIKAKDALVLSRNIPALYLASKLTHPNLYQLLYDAKVSNLKSESWYGLALALGGAEMSMQELASLYAMLATEGVWHPLRKLKETPQNSGKRLLSPEASFLVLEMLKDTPRPGANFSAGNASGITQTMPISWKTGTSSGFRDAWSVGTVGPYVLTVWIGNFDNKSNPAFVGKNIAAPLFFELIDAIKQERGPLPVLEKHPESMNLVRIPVCKASGMLPTRYCKDTTMTWFIPGKSPIKTDTIYREVAIDAKTGLRSCHFDKNTRFEIYEFWPSDLLKIFKRAGIERRTPPFFDAQCALTSTQGLKPQISSPLSAVSYIVGINASQKNQIPFTAVSDAEVAKLYWFINEAYLGYTSPNHPLYWNAKQGKFTVRVVDDHGLSDARDIEVKLDFN